MTATDQDTMVCGCFSHYLCVESQAIFLHALRAIGGPEPPPPRSFQKVIIHCNKQGRKSLSLPKSKKH
eukprot:scaffold32826_cov53-Attheya_sp.AAC.1